MKDNVLDILSPLKDFSNYISERVSNPLGLGFILSWCVVNWKAIYFFLSSNKEPEIKIQHLRSMYTVKGKCIDVWSVNQPSNIIDTTIVDSTSKVENVKNVVENVDCCKYFFDLFTYTDTSVFYYELVWLPLLLAFGYLIVAPIIINMTHGIWYFFNTSSASLSGKVFYKRAFLNRDFQYTLINKIDLLKEQLERKKHEVEESNTALNLIIYMKESDINHESVDNPVNNIVTGSVDCKNPSYDECDYNSQCSILLERMFNNDFNKTFKQWMINVVFFKNKVSYSLAVNMLVREYIIWMSKGKLQGAKLTTTDDPTLINPKSVAAVTINMLLACNIIEPVDSERYRLTKNGLEEIITLASD